jgi:hypothetical protein
MSLIDALAAVGRLVTAFGQKDMTEERVALYAQELQDIAPGILSAAVKDIIQGSKFFPSVSEIRQAASRSIGLRLPPTAEFLAIVRRADVRKTIFRRDGSPAYVERYWEWPEELDQVTLSVIQETLAKVGEPAGVDDKPYFAWETGIAKVYEQEAEKTTRLLLSDMSRLGLPGGGAKELPE